MEAITMANGFRVRGERTPRQTARASLKDGSKDQTKKLKSHRLH
jgi:hypothetical protein